MLLGCYWSARPVSLEIASHQIVSFLTEAALTDPGFSRWYLKGSSRPDPRKEVALDVTSVSAKLRTQVSDFGKEPMPELGYGFDVWNGVQGSFGVSIGMSSVRLRNAVTLSAPDRGPGSVREQSWLEVMRAAISVFDPDSAVVVSNAARVRPPPRPFERIPPGPPLTELAWLVYARGGDIQQHLDRLPPWSPLAAASQ